MSRLDSLCARLADYGFGGAVGVLGRDGVVLARGYGRADQELKVPVTTATRFDLGSLTKQFTAVAVLQLAGEGRLHLGDAIGAYLPDVPGEKRGITLRQLLTHTSGLVRNAQPLGIDASSTRDQFVKAVLASRLVSQPGAEFHYSDVGYDLLAAIVERVTGERFEDELAARVFRPAGMRHTAHADRLDPSSGPTALSYRGAFGEGAARRVEGPSATSWVNRGSGGVCSSIDDLLLWERALESGNVLAKPLRDSLFAARVPAGPSAYGFGWFVDTTAHGTPRIHHGGDIAGYKAVFVRLPEDGITIVALCNTFGWEPLLDDDLESMIFGRGHRLPPPARDLPMSRLGEFEGTLEDAAGARLVLWAEGGRLSAGLLSQQAADLFTDPTGRLAPTLHSHSGTIRSMIGAFENGDFSMLSHLLRARDLAMGLDRRVERFWRSTEERQGPLDGYEVIASVPAQDGTMVTFLRLTRRGHDQVVRYVWRADKIATVGSGLPFPSVELTPVGPSSFAFVNRRTLRYATLSFPDGPAGAARFAYADSGTEPVVLTRSRTPHELPKRDVAVELMPVILKEGVASGLALLERIRTHSPGRYDLSEDALNRLGYDLLRRDRPQDAASVFRRNVHLYPRSANVYDSYAQALLAAGDSTAALANYRKALELDPESSTAGAAVRALTAGHPGSR